MNRIQRGKVWGAALLLASSIVEASPFKNGFDLAGSLVPPDTIEQGGPPRDGIPALERPAFVGAATARFLNARNEVLGIDRHGVAKAYPIAILNWHEVVNDEIAGEPVVITFCPLCGSGVAFLANVQGRRLVFGVSGLLYNSDVLLYDHQTNSLWSQLREQAISGPMKGSRLTAILLTQTTWADWRQRHPATLALSPDTGYARDYGRAPYVGYAQSERLMFDVRAHSLRYHYHPKERVLGVSLGGQFKAYPFVELGRTDGVVRDTVGGQPIEVHFDAANQSAAAFDRGGHTLPAVTAYWFAWYALHPNTAVFVAH